MDELIDEVKTQFINILKDKKYDTNNIKFENLTETIIKFYYKERFVFFINLNKFIRDDITRPQSNKWINYKNKIISMLPSNTLKLNNRINTICLIPVLRNHNLLDKCITSLHNQSEKVHIILLISDEIDKKFAIMHNIEFVLTDSTPLGKKIQTGLKYVKDNYYDITYYIMICNQTDIFTENWIQEGVGLLIQNDIVGKNSNFISNRFSDDVYIRDTHKSYVKKHIKCELLYVADSGIMFRRSFLDKIKWIFYPDNKNDNLGIHSFKKLGILKPVPSIGIIQNSNFIRINLSNDFKETIKTLQTVKFDIINEVNPVPTIEAKLIKRLLIRSYGEAPKKRTKLINNNESQLEAYKSFNNGSGPNITFTNNLRKILLKKGVIEKPKPIEKITYDTRINNIIEYSEIVYSTDIDINEEYKKKLKGKHIFKSLGITQVYVSRYISYWKDKIKSSYDLINYNDRLKPCLFFGVFNDMDIHSIKNHSSKKYILLDGRELDFTSCKDNNNKLKRIEDLLKLRDVIFISPSRIIQHELEKFKVQSNIFNINLCLFDNQFKPLSKFGNKIFIYNGEKTGEESYYGHHLYNTIAKHLPEFEFVYSNKLNINYNDMYKIYSDCFIGLRLSRIDGVSQCVQDMGLMGIPVIHNGFYYNSVRWSTIKDIITSIKFFKHCQTNYNSILRNNIILTEKMNMIKKKSGKILIISYPFKNNKVYSISVINFKSLSNDVCIHYYNGEVVKLINSELCNDHSINLNYIDTKLITDIKYLLIKSHKMNEFNLDLLTINETDITDIKTEAYTSKMLSVPEVQIYKKTYNKKYNVICILDTFSYKCFSYELNLFQITKDNWKELIDKNSIDFFLCESAWHGNNGSWEKQLTNYEENGDKEINKLIDYLNEKKISKIFYNKEDPFNFSIFCDFSKKFSSNEDCVITTDENMIPEYKKLGCANVIAFPFCCQPIIHNPINKTESNDKNIIFPCSYYAHKYLDRCDHMEKMIDMYINEIHIYDRQFIFNKQTKQINDFCKYDGWYDFPEKYNNLIKGSLNYEQVLSLYKQYKCVMNTNTVIDSKTMFSRRAVEAASSSIPIISDHSIGIKNILKDDVIYYDNKDDVNKLLNNEDYRRKIGDNLYKNVMHNYTYKHLINKIMGSIPCLINKVHMEKTTNDVFCLIFMNNIDNLPNFDYFIKNYKYTIISDIIKNDVLNTTTYDKIKDIDTIYQYSVIMNENCIYDNNYIENMLLANLYTDAQIFGKACYYYRNKNKLISKSLEHKFTNRINMNTLILKMDKKIKNLFNKKILHNIYNYIQNNFNGKNIYSVDRFDFLDNDYRYHHSLKKSINIKQIYEITNKKDNIIPIIMCTYGRIDQIDKTINSLNKQKNKNFELYIWNNNYDKKENLYNRINKSKPTFNLYSYDSEENIRGVGRFYMINKLLETNDFEYVIFIDDDQIFDENMVSIFKKNAKKKHSFNWYGRKFIKDSPYTIMSNINNESCAQYVPHGDQFDYGGTGCMVIDADIFRHDEFFNDFPKIYIYVEDLWMSFYAQKYLNYKFIRIKQEVDVIKDNKDQCTKIWDIKNLLLEYCREQGWDV